MHLKIPVCKLYHWMVLRINLLVLVFFQEHFYPGNDQEGSKYIHDPTELSYKRSADKYEDKTHDDGTQDAPKQNPMIVLRCYTESRKNKDHDEYIIHRKRILYNISG